MPHHGPAPTGLTLALLPLVESVVGRFRLCRPSAPRDRVTLIPRSPKGHASRRDIVRPGVFYWMGGGAGWPSRSAA